MAEKRRFRSAITGRFVRMTTWLRWPRLTISEQIVTEAEDDFPDG
jgi:hypothetical protein